MLDIMRQKKRMKAIVLWIVIIAVGGSMVIWGVALNLSGDSNRSASRPYAAKVDKNPILMKDFLETYSRSMQDLKNSAGTELDPELLKSLGFSQQVLNRLIMGEIVEILARRLGATATQNEIRQAIMNRPDLQIDGKFIGLEGYKQSLAMAQIPLETFENDVRYRRLVTKLTWIITDSLEISDREVREEFSRMNQTAMVVYVLLKKDDFKKQVNPTDAELEAYFEKNKDTYRIKEKRRARYLLVPTSQILPNIQVSEEEIKDE
jgi:peptidyl-prolyl cis-trans isomerase D